MKNMEISRRMAFAVHALAWTVYAAAMVAHNAARYGSSAGKVLAMIPLCMLVVYTTRWIFRRCWKRRRWDEAAAQLAGFYGAALLLGYGYITWLESRAGVPVHVEGAEYSHGAFLHNATVFYLRYTGYGLGIFLLEQVLKRGLPRTERAGEGRLALHFLGNALQRCYGLLHGARNEAGGAVQQVSGLIDYALDAYSGTAPVLKPVNRELERLHTMMEIDRVDALSGPFVELEVHGDFSGFKVPSLTFITCYENMLKHGKTDDPARPARMVLETISGGLPVYGAQPRGGATGTETPAGWTGHAGRKAAVGRCHGQWL